MAGNRLGGPSYAVRPLTAEPVGIAGKPSRRETRWTRWSEFGCESSGCWLSEVRVFLGRRSRDKGSLVVLCWEPVFGQECRSCWGNQVCSPDNGRADADDSGQVVVVETSLAQGRFPRERAAAKG